MATWADLDAEMVRMLGTVLGASIIEADRIANFNRAQQHFAAWHTAKLITTTFSGDGTTREFTLPADFLDVYAFYAPFDDVGHILEPREFVPGVAWDQEADNGDTNRPHGYLEWPSGTLLSLRAPDEGTNNVYLYYFGLWPDITGTGDTVEPPVWAHEALLLYAVALHLVPALHDTAQVRQWGTDIDSGKPTDNPLIQAHDAFMARYYSILSKRSPQRRDVHFTSGGRN
jgi:hypothetical protein